MKRGLFIISVLLLSVTFFASNQCFASDVWNVNANFLTGYKALDVDYWEPVEVQEVYGVNVDFGQKSWPVNIAIALLASDRNDDTYYFEDIEGSTIELRVGIKKIWEPTTTMRPYIGGGLAIINAEFKGSVGDNYMNDTSSDNDQGVGWYVNGGLFWTVAKHLNLGFELGYSKAAVTLYDQDGEAGGGHALFLIGYHW
jgi:hypothetical protein